MGRNDMNLKSIVVGVVLAAGFVTLGAKVDTVEAATIQAVYYYPNLSSVDFGWTFTPDNPFVTGETETLTEVIPAVGPFATLVFSANSLDIKFLTIANWATAVFSGPVFTVVAGSPFNPVASVTGIATSLVSDTGSTLSINWEGLRFATDSEIVVNFVPTATPLPSTWLMLLSGFVGLGFFAYRGTKKHAAAIAA